MKKHFNILVYISLLFLCVVLYKADYLEIPHIKSFSLLSLSIVLVLLGFFVEAAIWTKTINLYNYKVSLANGIVSEGLSIFGKYIPGKIWTLLGRSAYIAKCYDYRESEMLYISVVSQFIFLWASLLIGSLAFFFVDVPFVVVGLSALSFIGLTVIILNKSFNLFVSKMISRVIKKDFNVPLLPFRTLLVLVPYYLLLWILWGCGFWCLSQSLTDFSVPIYAALIFPFAATVGIIIVVLPGGIGARESILGTMLLSISVPEAVTISVASRLWFLIGEGFLFVTALILKNLKKRKSKSNEVTQCN